VGEGTGGPNIRAHPRLAVPSGPILRYSKPPRGAAGLRSYLPNLLGPEAQLSRSAKSETLLCPVHQPWCTAAQRRWPDSRRGQLASAHDRHDGQACWRGPCNMPCNRSIARCFLEYRPQNAIITSSGGIYFFPPREAPLKMIYFPVAGIYFTFAGAREAENRPILLQLPKNGDRFISLPRPFLPPPPRQTPRRT
jgi:hypothetical protein